jgi:hypothetical protein
MPISHASASAVPHRALNAGCDMGRSDKQSDSIAAKAIFIGRKVLRETADFKCCPINGMRSARRGETYGA